MLLYFDDTFGDSENSGLNLLRLLVAIISLCKSTLYGFHDAMKLGFLASSTELERLSGKMVDVSPKMSKLLGFVTIGKFVPY